jgi:hypothetical protein
MWQVLDPLNASMFLTIHGMQHHAREFDAAIENTSLATLYFRRSRNVVGGQKGDSCLLY